MSCSTTTKAMRRVIHTFHRPESLITWTKSPVFTLLERSLKEKRSPFLFLLLSPLRGIQNAWVSRGTEDIVIVGFSWWNRGKDACRDLPNSLPPSHRNYMHYKPQITQSILKDSRGIHCCSRFPAPTTSRHPVSALQEMFLRETGFLGNAISVSLSNYFVTLSLNINFLNYWGAYNIHVRNEGGLVDKVKKYEN